MKYTDINYSYNDFLDFHTQLMRRFISSSNKQVLQQFYVDIADLLSALEGQDSKCKFPSVYDIDASYVKSLKEYLNVASKLMHQIINAPSSVTSQFLASSDDIQSYNEQSAVLWLNGRLQIMIVLVSSLRECDEIPSGNDTAMSNTPSFFRI
ncbi:MAG: hypothetical protein A3F13_06550 [Gammaproteobacteria bacterium RIFCSPHIGHO2_12_FULL_40_19]|nr:MAG: hypothetical protein A3F13_06550 [Gammaproteobacteria bacterium RIFCSPHIGHO2_12_FULL_40_19]